MCRILTITLCVTVLVGCAGGYDKAADSSCKKPAPPDQQAQWEMVAPGILSLGMDMQTKKRLGIDNSNQKAANTVTCSKPQTTDLQKIGAAFRIESRPG